MARPAGEDGTPLRTILERRAGRTSADPRGQQATEEARRKLVGPEFPEPMRYLWDWYHELAAGRGVGMSGLLPIAYQDIDAWSRLTGHAVTPVEVRALMTLDAVFRHPGEDEDDA